MNELLFALIIVAQVPNTSDQEVAVFTSQTQCMLEAQHIIQQGPSAYCVPVARQTIPEETQRS